ncbi:DUF1769-domain-containing protein [Leucogyrophana mollusca]|uniref:DUF1769-domain-containing protein n=1 Tax=Leucogyrophana mollusca TaxID=85980 RepID=A0ACB8BHW7_9AGAM|nr:DUF1769-domain-containing protein [Leucogyrophana mollusca]
MPRLRVLAGPSQDSLVPITEVVNSGTAHAISTDRFEGSIAVNIKGFTDPRGRELKSEYFERDDRKGITWSIQVQGRFLQPHSSDDVLFGNTFDKRLKMPWGSGAALKFMKYIDPTLEHDLASDTKPWAVSPLISTMPHFVHQKLHDAGSSSDLLQSSPSSPVSPFPPETSIKDDTRHLKYATSSSITSSSKSGSPASTSSSSLSSSDSSSSNLTSSSKKSSLSATVKNGLKKAHISKAKEGDGPPLFRSAGDRRSYFSDSQHRKEVVFGPNDVITTDFCYGFLEFNPTLALCLPGGISFDLMKYWDRHPVRFVCCERRKQESEDDEDPDETTGSAPSEGPVGKQFWCVSIEMAEDEEVEDTDARTGRDID